MMVYFQNITFWNSEKMAKKSRHDSSPTAFINIVGRNMLQNELLLSFVKKETGLKGACFLELESITKLGAHEPAIPRLLILDCKNVDMKNLWANIRKWNCSEGSPCFWVLCNAIADSVFEKKAMDSGVNGIFYNNDPLPLIAKGICAVLQGDLWYSRKALTQCLVGPKSLEDSSAHPALSRLTFREKEILACIASGYSSKAMADEFSISLHTVKTHIYNVYRKINVNNRLQASLWATKYL
jgi:DNA-binding NarL/FixJ family response regulator